MRFTLAKLHVTLAQTARRLKEFWAVNVLFQRDRGLHSLRNVQFPSVCADKIKFASARAELHNKHTAVPQTELPCWFAISTSDPVYVSINECRPKYLCQKQTLHSCTTYLSKHTRARARACTPNLEGNCPSRPPVIFFIVEGYLVNSSIILIGPVAYSGSFST
jgi:hypothetical protein